MTTGAAAASLRGFVALRPDAATRRQLATVGRIARARWPSAKAIDEADLHLTLAFIGALAPGEAELTQAALAGLGSPPRPLDAGWRLDRIGSFGSARVGWAGSAPDAVPAWLTGLARQVTEALDATGITYDRRRFVPHVTLLRNLPRAAAAATDLALAPPEFDGPIDWPLDAGSLRPRLLITQAPGARPRYADFGSLAQKATARA